MEKVLAGVHVRFHRAMEMGPLFKFRVLSMTENTDIKTYLAAFEGLISTNTFDESQWISVLVPNLISKALEAYKDYLCPRPMIIVP